MKHVNSVVTTVDGESKVGNTAVRALVNQGMGGAAKVNDRFKNELGLQHTYLQPLDANRFYVGNTTAREAMKNIKTLLTGNDQYQKLVKNALATNIYTDFGVRSQLAGNDYIVLANKVGILDDVDGNSRHDVGLIYNTKTHKVYGYAFMNTAMGEAYNTATAQAGISLADMGKGLRVTAATRPSSSRISCASTHRLTNLRHLPTKVSVSSTSLVEAHRGRAPAFAAPFLDARRSVRDWSKYICCYISTFR